MFEKGKRVFDWYNFFICVLWGYFFIAKIVGARNILGAGPGRAEIKGVGKRFDDRSMAFE
jgi:hypothetical protein